MTNILTASPNINGNIGSCTISDDTIQVANSIFTSDWQTTQINSCTGKIISQSNYTTYGGIICLIVLFLMMLAFFGAAMSVDSNY